MSDSPDNMADGEAFVALYTRHQHALRAFVRSLVFNREEADEVLQRASAIMWRQFPELRSRDAFVGWALSIARNTAMNYRRESARCRLRFSDELTELIADESSREQDLHAAQLRHLDGCIDKLPDRERQIVRSYYGAARVTADEVARTIGMNTNALYKALQRTRTALLRCIMAGLMREGYEL
ncbi:MAG: sigma-70 family RNA polymerase sigma factor [Phycisphaera sp.]|nr:sigma-70 family RNA polymerase sigma factor [Phycisphaera sp.]